MSTVGGICKRDVIVIKRASSVTHAAKLMRDHHVGTLVVTETGESGEPPVGIVTDRDLVVEIMAIGLDSDDVPVGEIMTQAPLTVRENEDARAALERMRQRGVRRLPVVTKGGDLVGIVSADDILKALAGEIVALASISKREHARETAQRTPVSL